MRPAYDVPWASTCAQCSVPSRIISYDTLAGAPRASYNVILHAATL